MEKLNWEEYFLAIAQISALRSKDPNTQVGAVIVNHKQRIIATGYNGMPKGDDSFPWKRKSTSQAKTKYPYVIHAEINAVLNATTPVENATIYITLFPCSQCSKILVHAGIKKIIYISEKYKNSDDDKIAKIILKQGKVEYFLGKAIKIEIKK